MASFIIGIAGLFIEVKTLHIRPAIICKDFILNDVNATLAIEMTQQDIDNERKQHPNDENYEIQWDGIVECQALFRKLADTIIDSDVLLVHGAVISVEDQAILFTASSGVGKTTHIRKWIESLPRAFVINGDKPFIKINGKGEPPLVCGSPWAGKENMYTNTMVPLKAIVLMERSKDNYIERITCSEAFPTFLRQVYRPDDEIKQHKTLNLLQQLVPEMSFWRFQFNNFKEDCFEVAYKALVKNEF